MSPPHIPRPLTCAVLSLFWVGNRDVCVAAFTTKPPYERAAMAPGYRRSDSTSTSLKSSIGGGGGDRPPPPSGGKDDGPWDAFFREESDNLRKAREYMSDNALPINYDEEDDGAKTRDSDRAKADSSSLVRSSQFFQDDSNLGKDALANNPYLQVVSKLSPSDMIARFTSTAHPRVQNAVRSTILSLIGGLPKMAFDTTTITTGQRLASLMFQLQVSSHKEDTHVLLQQQCYRSTPLTRISLWYCIVDDRLHVQKCRVSSVPGAVTWSQRSRESDGDKIPSSGRDARQQGGN